MAHGDWIHRLPERPIVPNIAARIRLAAVECAIYDVRMALRHGDLTESQTRLAVEALDSLTTLLRFLGGTP